MKFLKLLTVLFVGLMATQGCDIVNPAEDIPTYIRIDSFTFQATPNTGSTSHKITSAFVYLDGRQLGAFDLPATIPVLSKEPGLITVVPGVTFNGLLDIQTPYRFYLSDTMTLQPQPGATIQFAANTQYRPDTMMNLLNIDFESGNPFAQVDGDTGLVITNDPNYVFENDFSGLISFVRDTQWYSVSLMQNEFTTGSEPFIELNHKNSMPFQVGLQTTGSTGQTVVQYIVGFKPRDTWQKEYIGLADFVNAYPNKTYRVVIRVITDTRQNGYVALDNIKVISNK